MSKLPAIAAAAIRAALAESLGLDEVLMERFPHMTDDACFWAGLALAALAAEIAWHGGGALARRLWERLTR